MNSEMVYWATGHSLVFSAATQGTQANLTFFLNFFEQMKGKAYHGTTIKFHMLLSNGKESLYSQLGEESFPVRDTSL